MKKYSRIIKYLVSALFLTVVYIAVREEGMWGTLQNVDPLFLALSIGLSVVMLNISCLKWYILLRQQGHVIPFHELIRTYLIGYYFTNILPSNFGGDIVRTYYVGKRIQSFERAAVSVFLERFTGFILLLLLACIMPFFYPDLWSKPAIWIPAIGAVCGILGFTWLAFAKQPSRIPRKIVRTLETKLLKRSLLAPLMVKASRLFEKLCNLLDSFHQKLVDAGKEIGKNPAYMFPVLIITLVFYTCTLLNVYLAFRAFGVVPSFVSVAAIIPTVMVVTMLPLSALGNLGVAEFSWIYYCGLVGIGEPDALAMGILLRVKVLMLGIIGFPFYLAHKGEYTVKEKVVEKST